MQQNNNRPKFFWWLITCFLLVPLIVSVISTIHVINFFELANSTGLALTLAIAFELGALSGLAGLVALDKINKNVVWFIFILLTAYQMMGNTYDAYDNISIKMITNPDLIKNYIELFGLTEEDTIFVKRLLAIKEGAILPIVSLSFLHLAVNYIQKSVGIKKMEPETVAILPEPQETTTTGPVVEEDDAEDEIDVSDLPNEVELVDEENKSVEESTEDIVEEPTEPNEDFKAFMEHKKRQVEDMREPNLELLDIFYNQGVIQKGDELLTYNELLSKIDRTRFTQKEINFFLTLCNYLEIFRLSGIQRIALMSYDEAKKTLSDYLTIGDES